MSRPLLSIVVPCYNAADTLAATIKSVRSQSFRDWELLLANDGSTDATAAVAQASAAEDRRVRYLPLAHRGLGATRNRAVDRARAEHVLFLDADDVLFPDALEVLATAARRAPHAVLAPGFAYLDESLHPLGVQRFPSLPGASVDTYLKANRTPATLVWPRRVAAQLGFDEQLTACEDWDAALRLMHHGVNVQPAPRVLWGYRLRARSMSRPAANTYRNGRAVLERWRPFAVDPTDCADVVHRWAVACGALALARGDSDALTTWWRALPDVSLASDFPAIAASGVDWAFSTARGAVSETWRTHRDDWLAQIEPWLHDGPLAALASDILNALGRVTFDPLAAAQRIVHHVRQRPHIRRVLIYGVGSNGLNLIEQLRRAAVSIELCVADDFANAATLAMIDLKVCDPHGWPRWPRDTAVVVTPNDAACIHARLAAISGFRRADVLDVANQAFDGAAAPRSQ